MSDAGPEKVALFLRLHRDELTRIWRMGRLTARGDVFPGLIDGVVESFLDACCDVLATGGEPEKVLGQVGGVFRWVPALVPAEVHREWALLAEVVSAACDSMHVDDGVREWLGRATTTCRQAMAGLAQDRRQAPPGIVTALVYSSLAPRRVRTEHGTNA